MARPLRLEIAGMWYHVMNRGNRRATIFHDNEDRLFFLDKLWTYCARFCVELDSYALMDSHFHLFLCTHEANLSRFMHDLETTYAGHFNWRHACVGHLFQGRYKAPIVERAGYGAAVNRYIHLNPVRGGKCVGRNITELQATLRAYRWSSYRAYLGLDHRPAALNVHETLSRFGLTLESQQAAYAAYIEEGLLHEVADPLNEAVDAMFLGSSDFIERIRRTYCTHKEREYAVTPCQARTKALPIASVLAAVAQAYDIEVSCLLSRKRVHGEPRKVALWLACKWCNARLTLVQIGSVLGMASYSGVQKARDRFNNLLACDEALQKRVSAIEEYLLR
jgi:putative transposase